MERIIEGHDGGSGQARSAELWQLTREITNMELGKIHVEVWPKGSYFEGRTIKSIIDYCYANRTEGVRKRGGMGQLEARKEYVNFTAILFVDATGVLCLQVEPPDGHEDMPYTSVSGYWWEAARDFGVEPSEAQPLSVSQNGCTAAVRITIKSTTDYSPPGVVHYDLEIPDAELLIAEYKRCPEGYEQEAARSIECALRKYENRMLGEEVTYETPRE